MKIIKKLIFNILIILILMKYSTIYTKLFFGNNKKKLMKKIILYKIFKLTRKNINNINYLFIKGKSRFGNFFISINNAIIYCEILGCKKIILEKNNNIYINNIILYKKSNFTIEPNQTFNIRDKYSIILNTRFFFYNNIVLFRNVNRFIIFREQLLNNLPKVIVHPSDLYIYIRSGDIFIRAHRNYNQPPLCFYEAILDSFKFNKVYIISEDKLNPVIPNLLNKYSYIKKKK